MSNAWGDHSNASSMPSERLYHRHNAAPPPPPPPPYSGSGAFSAPRTTTSAGAGGQNQQWSTRNAVSEAANAFAPGVASNPMANMAVSYVEGWAQKSWGKYIPGLVFFWEGLRHRFNVDNVYVRKKIRLLLVPYQQSWARKYTTNGNRSPVHPSRDNSAGATGMNGNLYPHQDAAGARSFLPPSKDVNAPDLYIPLMSFITFIVMTGLLKGTVGEFTPTVLSEVMTSSLVLEFMEILIIRLGMIYFKQSEISTLDVLCLSFYKYVGLCIVTLSYLFLGSIIYYAVLLWTSLALAWFYICTLKHSTMRGSLNPGSANGAEIRTFLFGIAAAQPFILYWMSHTG